MKRSSILGAPEGAVALDKSGTTVAPEENAAYNSEWVLHTRDEWVRAQMLLAEPAYTSIVPTLLFVGTWNVNGKKPEEEVVAGITAWISSGAGNAVGAAGTAGGGGGSGSGATAPELVVVGFQEMVDLNAVNVASGAKSGERSAAWQGALGEALRRAYPAAQFSLVAAKHLVGILQLVYVRADRASVVRGVQSLNAATGIGGIMGNKGDPISSMRSCVVDQEFHVLGPYSLHRVVFTLFFF